MEMIEPEHRDFHISNLDASVKGNVLFMKLSDEIRKKTSVCIYYSQKHLFEQVSANMN